RDGPVGTGSGRGSASPALGAGRRRRDREQRAGRRGRLAALADERHTDQAGLLRPAAVGRRHPGWAEEAGLVGVALVCQGCQSSATPTKPASSARPPWEDATQDGNGVAKVTEDPAIYVPAGPAGALTAAFAKAAGAAAVTETLNGVRERSAAGYIGWPPARLAARLRGEPPAHKL